LDGVSRGDLHVHPGAGSRAAGQLQGPTDEFSSFAHAHQPELADFGQLVQVVRDLEATAVVGNGQADTVRLEGELDLDVVGCSVELYVVQGSLSDTEERELGLGRQPPGGTDDDTELGGEVAAVADMMYLLLQSRRHPERVERRGPQIPAESPHARDTLSRQVTELAQLFGDRMAAEAVSEVRETPSDDDETLGDLVVQLTGNAFPLILLCPGDRHRVGTQAVAFGLGQALVRDGNRDVARHAGEQSMVVVRERARLVDLGRLQAVDAGVGFRAGNVSRQGDGHDVLTVVRNRPRSISRPLAAPKGGGQRVRAGSALGVCGEQ
jgi:hypothetical protein